MTTQKKNGKVMTAKNVRTEEDFKNYLRQTNHPLAEQIINAREETQKIFGRLLTEKEIKELIIER